MPDIMMFMKFEMNTTMSSPNTKNSPSRGMADRATAIKLNSRNGNIKIKISFKHTLMVRKNLITLTGNDWAQYTHSIIASTICSKEFEKNFFNFVERMPRSVFMMGKFVN